MSGRAVYAAINAITAELASAGIAKTRTNEVDGYTYRSIDDVMGKLAPLLAKHRLCILPRVSERLVTERADTRDGLIVSVALKVAFTLTSVDDGSSHLIEVYGEALDGGDKATAKAMSAAFKSAMVQTFCIPVPSEDLEPDKAGWQLSARTHDPEPVEGWEQWCEGIRDILGVCESNQAIATVRERNRGLLKALSRERPTLYARLGDSFAQRTHALAARLTRSKSSGSERSGTSARKPKKPAKSELLEHA